MIICIGHGGRYWLFIDIRRVQGRCTTIISQTIGGCATPYYIMNTTALGVGITTILWHIFAIIVLLLSLLYLYIIVCDQFADGTTHLVVTGGGDIKYF